MNRIVDSNSVGFIDIEIASGYRPGLIGDITKLHATYYSRETGFGQRFESGVATGMAELCDRLSSPANGVWSAMRGSELVGSVAIDGEHLGPGLAHLRFFIVGDGVRGLGVGRRLLLSALAFADAHGFEETHLWTFSGLHAARHLYERAGFVCREQRPGDQWGNQVMEQRFVRSRCNSAGDPN